jgi:hypothetical protein
MKIFFFKLFSLKIGACWCCHVEGKFLRLTHLFYCWFQKYVNIFSAQQTITFLSDNLWSFFLLRLWKMKSFFFQAEIYTFKVCREPYFAVISTSGNGKQSTCRFMCRNCRLCTKFFKSAFQDFCTILLQSQHQSVQLKYCVCLLSVCLAVPHSIHPCVVCMSFSLSICLSASLFSVHLSVCQYVRLSVCPLSP